MQTAHILGTEMVDLSEYGMEPMEVPILDFSVMAPNTTIVRSYEIRTLYLIGHAYCLSNEALQLEKYDLYDRARWVRNFMKTQGLLRKDSDHLHRTNFSGAHFQYEIWSTDYTPAAYK